MDDPQHDIICSVQVGNVEVEVWRSTYAEVDDDDREDAVLEFLISASPVPSCRERIRMDDLPDLLQALGRMLAIVREHADPHAASKIDLDQFFAALNVPPPGSIKGSDHGEQ